MRTGTFFRAFGVFLAAAVSLGAAQPPVPLWPTSNRAFEDFRPLDQIIEPATGSDRVESGLFGMTRDAGRRFHEGMDLKAVRRDRRGVAQDLVRAAFNGKVVYINEDGSHSDYGRYVILEHRLDVPIYTLYGHLDTIDRDLRLGAQVHAGQNIGVIGRTASSVEIAKKDAHLHFEMGLRLSTNFQAWYDAKGLQGKNYHGNYNGLNLVGFDPLDFYETARAGELVSVRDYLRNQPTAFTVRIVSRKVPTFVMQHAGLLEQALPVDAEVGGFDVEFTWWGLPKRWKPFPAGTEVGAPEGRVFLLSYDPALLGKCAARGTLIPAGETPELGPLSKSHLELIFLTPVRQ